MFILIIIILQLISLTVPFFSEYYEKYIKDLQIKSQSETITGILLMYPKYCVQVIEVNLLFLCYLHLAIILDRLVNVV